MSEQVVVILDNPLLDSDPWADAVFREAKLTPVENDLVTKTMVKDPDAKKALLANISDPMGSQETLSPHYRKTLAQLYGDKPRLGIYGTAWLVHVDNVAACVVDWSEVMKRANAPNVNASDREYSINLGKDFLHKRVEAHLADKSRYHEIEPGLPEAERVERTLAFLREKGVI